MRLPLPRLNNLADVSIEGKPSIFLLQNWDRVCTAIENITPNAVTNHVDAPITGYVTIILPDGSTAKLAVIA